MFKQTLLCLLAGAALYGQAPPPARTASPDQAVALVKRVIRFSQDNGADLMFAVVGKGFFTLAEDASYNVSVYEKDGTIRALSYYSDQIGKDGLKTRDADGKAVVKDLLQLAKAKDSGWMDSHAVNPATGKAATRATYFEHCGKLVVAADFFR